MPQHGVTTVVTGNCSCSLMPRRDCVAASGRVRLHRGHPGRRVRDRFRGTGSRTPSGGTPCGRTAPRCTSRRSSAIRTCALRDPAPGTGPRRPARGSVNHGGGTRRLALGRRPRPLDVVHRPGPAPARGAQPRRRRRRVAARCGSRRSAARTRAASWRGPRVPPVDQGDPSPAGRHRPGARWARHRRRGVHLETSSRRTAATVACRMHHRAGAPAPADGCAFAGLAAAVQPQRQLRSDPGVRGVCPVWGRLITQTPDEKVAHARRRRVAGAGRCRRTRSVTGSPSSRSRLDRVRLTSVRDG